MLLGEIEDGTTEENDDENKKGVSINALDENSGMRIGIIDVGPTYGLKNDTTDGTNKGIIIGDTEGRSVGILN